MLTIIRDDIVFFSDSIDMIELIFKKIEIWSNNEMKVNGPKYGIMKIIDPNKGYIINQRIIIQNLLIPIVESYKYLGVNWNISLVIVTPRYLYLSTIWMAFIYLQQPNLCSLTFISLMLHQISKISVILTMFSILSKNKLCHL